MPTLEEILPALIAAGMILLISFPVHEFSHALAAWRLGDSTARLMGRLTLDPRRHFDPLGAALLLVSSLVGVGIGWAKPTPVNPMMLRHGRTGEAIVAAAGPVSNLVLAIAGAIPLRFLLGSDLSMPLIVYDVIWWFILINVALAIFNLIPVPPLDGSKVLFRFLPPQTAWRLRPVLEQYGLVILLVVLLFLGPVLLTPVIYGAAGLLVGV